MILVVKMLLVAIGIFGQAKALPKAEDPVISELDTLTLPEDHPELALARRAMASEGLCRHDRAVAADSAWALRPADLPTAPVNDLSIVRLVAEACD